MSSESLTFDDESWADTPIKKPSYLFFYLGCVSVIGGLAIGIYGIFSSSQSSNELEYVVGIIGYLLTALIPIGLFQLTYLAHRRSLSENQDQPYDFYAGTLLQSKFKKIVFLGLVSASPSIYVLLLPIAERFTS